MEVATKKPKKDDEEEEVDDQYISMRHFMIKMVGERKKMFLSGIGGALSACLTKH